jgi:quercetin dioxygenase-like cupin family protein
MTTSTPSGAARTDREPGTSAPLASFDVPFELARLRAERAFEVEGHAGRTLTKLPDLRAVLETMKAGIRLPFHETPERVTLQVLLGQLRLWLEHGENLDLAEGSFVAVEAGRIHEIECLEDCAFLLTLAWPAERRAPKGDGPQP